MRMLCRDCGATGPALEPGDGGTCAACGGVRVLRHPELADLSVAHLDCDAFYAAIEKRDDPSLAARPVIVGGGRRGVVSTCCYLARAFGVRSAMPMFKALALCPDAAVVRPDMAKYAAVGAAVRAEMKALTPKVEPISIDEAFMDLSGTEALHGGPPALTLVRLQARIEQKLAISVSIGLSYNKFLAKTASDLDKPRGFSVIGRAEALEFLAPRPVGSLPGVGPRGAEALNRAGWRTVGDLRRAGPKALTARLGDGGERLWRLANGIDHRQVDPLGDRKSISAETTFFEDISAREDLEDVLWALCERVAARARAIDTAGRTVTLKLKDSRFRTITRRRSLGEPTILAHTVFDVGRDLLAPEARGATYRLIGIGLSDLCNAALADKGDLMDVETPRRAAAEAAVASARARFGKAAIRTGRAVRADRRDG